MAARLTAYLVAFIVGITIVAGLIVGAQREDQGPADLIVLNGRVFTADAAGSTADAVAVQGNTILLVGGSREVQRLRGSQTVVVDAKGGTVLPGFTDSHIHLYSGGQSLAQLNLSDARTLADIRKTIHDWATAHPDRAWVTGRGWYYDPFDGGLPTRQLLDELVPNRPAYLSSYDGHTGWANTQALKAAGITRRTPNPADGTIVKDPRTGEPTGVLKESAMALIRKAMPPASRAERLAAVRAAIGEAHRHGITSVQNASGSADELALYDELRRAGELTLRISAALSAEGTESAAELDALAAVREKYGDDPTLKAPAIKLFADGVIETFTAAMLAPYATKPDTRGTPRLAPADLDRVVADLDRRGWQILIHAIGDRAVRLALDAFERAAAANPAPARGRRHRIEHIEVIDAADVPRFGALGVIASVQPYHGVPTLTPQDAWLANVGPVRAQRSWIYGSIARAGGRLAFGSDWPVMTINPLRGLHVAVNRTTVDGQPPGGQLPGERLTLADAIAGYTRAAAYASFDDHRKGVLARDMLADIVVLSKDIFALPASRLAEAVVDVTIVDGKVVFRRAADSN